MSDAFRRLHVPGRPLLLPNAWDFASAAALVDAGFVAIGTTSLGVAAAHGLPDGRGLSRAQTVASARLLGRLPCLLTVDIEAGFGPAPRRVADVAGEVAAAGAVGVNLEDGRPDGSLAPPALQQELIAAVRTEVPGLFVNARIDTHWVPSAAPPALADTVERARAYLAAGADGVFVPGLIDEADIRATVAAVPAPVNVLLAPGRHTVAGLARLGVARVSLGSLLFRAALHTAVSTALAVAGGATAPDGGFDYAAVNGLAERLDGGPTDRRPTDRRT